MKKIKVIILIFLAISLSGCISKDKNTVVSVIKNNEDKNNNLELTTNDLVKKVGPAVVFISTETQSGSGMIVDKGGYILTNAHVIEGYKNIDVNLLDGRMFKANVVGSDEDEDLAIIKINGDGLPLVELGDSDLLKQGEKVFSLGYSIGIDDNVSIKDGIFSRKVTIDGKEYIEATAEIQNGSSGGALINDKGLVIGIIVAGIAGFGDELKLFIPINKAKLLMPLLKSGTVKNNNVSSNVDSDDDGLTDKEEMILQTDPLKSDTDNDGLTDREEVKVFKTDPRNPDTDGDGFTDGDEVRGGYNPIGPGKLFYN